MATSLFGLLQGGAQQAVRDAAIAEHPRALQRAQGAVSAGTLRAGANPVAVSRQYAQQTADMGARLAEQQKRALAQAKMEDAAGASQLLGNVLGAGATLGAMAIPGAQAAKPFVDMAIDKGTTALGRAFSQPAGGVPDPRGALAGAQPVQGSQQPLTGAEAAWTPPEGPLPPNPYQASMDASGQAAQERAAYMNSLAPVGSAATPGMFPTQEGGAPGETLADLNALDAALGTMDQGFAAAAAPQQAQPAARPRPVSPTPTLPPWITPAGQRALQAEANPTPTLPPWITPEGQRALQRDAAPPTAAPPMFPSPTLSGSSPEEQMAARQADFNARMSGPRVSFGQAIMEPPVPTAPPMYPEPTLATPGPPLDTQVEVTRRDGIILPEDRARSQALEAAFREDFNARMNPQVATPERIAGARALRAEYNAAQIEQARQEAMLYDLLRRQRAAANAPAPAPAPPTPQGAYAQGPRPELPGTAMEEYLGF